jgi:hypothetical protein
MENDKENEDLADEFDDEEERVLDRGKRNA